MSNLTKTLDGFFGDMQVVVHLKDDPTVYSGNIYSIEADFLILHDACIFNYNEHEFVLSINPSCSLSAHHAFDDYGLVVMPRENAKLII